MKIHELKIWEDFAGAVYSGEKTFEISNNDRDFHEGDIIIFNVIDDLMLCLDHPLNSMAYKITYVLNGWGLKEGYVALAIKPVNDKY